MTQSANREPASDPGIAISVSDLTIALPPNMERENAVKDISFDLRKGEILCIVGESGSGKSVTASAIMGLLPSAVTIARGSIRLREHDLVRTDRRTMRDLRGRVVSMIFQDPLSALNPLMKIGSQIDEILEAHRFADKAGRSARVLELLEEVGLPDPALLQHQYPFQLSGGQRQRVMIAIALALGPDVLIADEPTTALDVTTQAQILDLIRRLQRERGMSVMFITHDFGVVAELADRVIVMEKGLIVEQGEAPDVLNKPRHPYTQRLIAAVPHMIGEGGRQEESTGQTVMEVRGISKTYRARSGPFAPARVVRAVKDVSFAVRRGQTLGIVGESGSGKSTLGRIVLKLLDADSGDILLQGQNVARLSNARFRHLRPQVQMIFQDPFASLNPRQTIGWILTVGPQAHGMAKDEARDKALSLLELVGLDSGAYDRFPHEFSGGQRQRIGIARALMLDPALLIADEAVSALDVSIQAQILDLLGDIQKRTDIAIIFITHDLRVASQICDEVAVMNRGEIVEHGPPSRIFLAPQHAYTRGLVDAIPGADWMPAT